MFKNSLHLITPHLDILPLMCILDWYFTVLHTCWKTISTDSADSADSADEDSLNITSLTN